MNSGQTVRQTVAGGRGFPEIAAKSKAPAAQSGGRPPTVLINMSTLKGGGGQNVAMNFLLAVAESQPVDVNLLFLVARHSEPHKYLAKQRKYGYAVAPRNPLCRILYELFGSWYYLVKFRVDIIYSYFGFGLFPSYWPQVSGSADSNLYFPEVDFWFEYSGVARLRRAIVDRYRILGIKRAAAVVFENEALERRARELYGLKHTVVIKPSIHRGGAQIPTRLKPFQPTGVPRGLFLCNWHLNKRASLIPTLAAELRRRDRDFTFVLTAPLDGSREHRAFCRAVAKLNVEAMVSLIGPVEKAKLANLYQEVDYIFLLSKLESFSNNIIEAWTFAKPLIVADEPWARALCGESAVYVDRDSAVDIVDHLEQLLDNPRFAEHLVNKGRQALHEYPTIEQRTAAELEYLRHVCGTG